MAQAGKDAGDAIKAEDWAKAGVIYFWGGFFSTAEAGEDSIKKLLPELEKGTVIDKSLTRFLQPQGKSIPASTEQDFFNPASEAFAKKAMAVPNKIVVLIGPYLRDVSVFLTKEIPILLGPGTDKQIFYQCYQEQGASEKPTTPPKYVKSGGFKPFDKVKDIKPETRRCLCQKQTGLIPQYTQQRGALSAKLYCATPVRK